MQDNRKLSFPSGGSTFQTNQVHKHLRFATALAGLELYDAILEDGAYYFEIDALLLKMIDHARGQSDMLDRG